MISKPIRHSGICFPEAILYNASNEFVVILCRKLTELS